MNKLPKEQNDGNHCHRTEYRKKNGKKIFEDSLRDLWDTKRTNICSIEVTEGEEREKEPEKTFEKITAENFSNMGKENQAQKAQSPRLDKHKKVIQQHIVQPPYERIHLNQF